MEKIRELTPDRLDGAAGGMVMNECAEFIHCSKCGKAIPVSEYRYHLSICGRGKKSGADTAR